MSRFGALSTVLFDMSDRWEEFTPPYILLLIRTFLTLEGVAGQVPLSGTLCVLPGSREVSIWAYMGGRGLACGG